MPTLWSSLQKKPALLLPRIGQRGCGPMLGLFIVYCGRTVVVTEGAGNMGVRHEGRQEILAELVAQGCPGDLPDQPHPTSSPPLSSPLLSHLCSGTARKARISTVAIDCRNLWCFLFPHPKRSTLLRASIRACMRRTGGGTSRDRKPAQRNPSK